MATDVAHKRWWQIFEVVFGLPLLVAIGLQRVRPLSFPHGSFTPAITLASALLVIGGVVLVVRARREFAQYGQPTDPGQPTRQLVTTGVFAISRNPLYLGGVCLLIGSALIFQWPWVLVLLLPALAICHYVLIVPEERYLAAKFGAEYQAYTAAVPRWFGHVRPRSTM